MITATTTYTLTCNGLNSGSQDTATTTVTVASAPVTDADADSINDSVEQSAPNSGDSNNDGTPDASQAHAASFINEKTGRYNTIETENGCSLQRVTSNKVSFANETVGGTKITALRYTVEDGGGLDQDGNVNGTILDPVTVVEELSQADMLAETGSPIQFYLAAAILIALMAIGMGYYGYKEVWIKEYN